MYGTYASVVHYRHCTLCTIVIYIRYLLYKCYFYRMIASSETVYNESYDFYASITATYSKAFEFPVGRAISYLPNCQPGCQYVRSK